MATILQLLLLKTGLTPWRYDMWKKSDNKKSKEELQEYLKFRNRGSKTPNKKAYTRKEKHKSKGD